MAIKVGSAPFSFSKKQIDMEVDILERTIKNEHCKKILAFILILSVLLSSLPLSGHNHTAYAAQQNSYHDPAEHWMSAVNRTNDDV